MLKKMSKDNWTNRVRAVFFASLGLLVGCLFLFSFQSPSWLIYDFAQKLSAPSEQSAVGLVVVDQMSLDRLAEEGVVFPLPRQLYGAVAEVAKEAKAKAVFFDLMFTETSSYGNEDDKLFAELLKRSKVPIFFPAKSAKGSVKEPLAVLKEVSKGLGAVNFRPESDGIFRRTPDLIEGEISLPQSLYTDLTGFTEAHQRSLQANYSEKAFPFISLYNVLKIYRDLQDGKKPSVDLTEMGQRIWVVGYSAPSLFDLKPMPLDHAAPGMLITATGIANRFLRQGYFEVSAGVQVSLIFLMVLLAVFLMNRASDPIRASTWLLAVSFLIPSLCLYFFWRQSTWFNPIPLLVGTLVAGAMQLVWNFQMQWRERLKLVKSLQHTMSEEMLELIRTGEVLISRFGEEREITVFFSDLEGFTTLSEKSTPVETVNILNAYLDDVVELILANSGYVDKFIGDAIMVLWGAPVNQAQHAQMAFQTALKFHYICNQFNAKMKLINPEFVNLKTRVGLHTGRAIVGNIGAKQRHNYTAIGDSVNLASRVEGIGKNYDIELTMTEDFVRAADAWKHPGLLEIDQIAVKGKTEPTRIYTLIGVEHKEAMLIYQDGLKLYYQGQWQAALDFFNKATGISAKKVMIKRCETALTKGELTNWHNGAWFYDSK
jgi:adenylate cyclase